MKKLWLALVVTLAGSAYAGQHMGIGGEVTVNGTVAQGSLSGAYNSADTTQQIGCMLYGTPGSPAYAVCWATDAKNVHMYCESDDPAVVQAAGTVSNASYLIFIRDKAGQCLSVSAYGDSTTDLKRPQ